MKDNREEISVFKECGKEVLSLLGTQLYKVLEAAGMWLKEGVEILLGDDGRREKMGVKITSVKEEFLKLDRLVEIGKANIVPNSNQIVALIKKCDKSTIIYLAYCKDKELLPEKENN